MLLLLFGMTVNPNSLHNKGSWRILKDLYCSVTMLREFGLMKLTAYVHVHTYLSFQG